ncbi:ArdC-like ssDNA-binding domain-containing protein [Ensifer adhaerens]|uniref:ArdC-like ssDNA-binding domain-containing protein n=1 Tax=Ensifer adhaerens TaxID=106592 RepID=UPI003F82E4DC
MGKAKATETTSTVSDIYERITARIVEQLEAGTRPWMQPWGAGGTPVRPLRHNGIAYRGINTVLLWMTAAERGYNSSYWMTFRQAVRRASRMKGVTDGSMSSVQLCRRFPHAVPVTARCEAGMKAQDGNAASAFRRARRRSEGRTRVNSH